MKKLSPDKGSFLLQKRLERNRNAIDAVNNYISLTFFEPKENWNDNEFQKRCYERWASDEILNKLIFNPMDDPLLLIRDFVFDMRKSYRMCTTRESEIIFSIGASVGEDIALIFV